MCEGEKTEPNYFREYPVNATVECVVCGIGGNTITVVDEAIRLGDEARVEGKAYSEVWAVFDRDSFTPQRFNTALSKAAQAHVEVAWTNEAFELWYLLHFEYCDAALSRTTYSERLSKYLGRPYVKNDATMYALLKPRQTDAVRSAVKLLAWQRADPNYQPRTANPATTVHLLVERLNGLRS